MAGKIGSPAGVSDELFSLKISERNFHFPKTQPDFFLGIANRQSPDFVEQVAGMEIDLGHGVGMLQIQSADAGHDGSFFTFLVSFWVRVSVGRRAGALTAF